jgi:agmatinase
MGLEAADSIRDRTISTFSRGELPHYAGINTFLKAPYLEDVRQVGNYDVAIVGVPHDSGTTYRPGTRFGPQGIRRISALYTPTTLSWGWICGSRLPSVMSEISSPFRVITKSPLTRFPKVLPTSLVQGPCPLFWEVTTPLAFPRCGGSVATWGIKRWELSTSTAMWTPRKPTWMSACTPAPGSTPPTWPMPRPKTWCSLGIGGWQVPRQGVKVCRERATNILTVTDITEMGLDASVDFALEHALDGTDCVWISFDIDCIDAGFVPGTGWPEPGGLLPREALYLLGKRIVQESARLRPGGGRSFSSLRCQRHDGPDGHPCDLRCHGPHGAVRTTAPSGKAGLHSRSRQHERRCRLDLRNPHA